MATTTEPSQRGIVLRTFENTRLEEQHIDLAAGDQPVVDTDGVAEALNG